MYLKKQIEGRPNDVGERPLLTCRKRTASSDTIVMAFFFF